MSFFYKIKYIRLSFMLVSLVVLFASACTKKEIIGEDPYTGGKESLGVRFDGKYPSPERGRPGSEVSFTVKGLKAWEGKFEFRINDQVAEIVGLSDSTIRVIVPPAVSSGGASIKLEGQVFFGPRFEVLGNVSIDKGYAVVNGSNYPILDAIDHGAGLLLVGSFTDFENQASKTLFVNSIAAISNSGEFSANLNAKKGANGGLTSINRLSNGQYIVSGSFTTFNERNVINSITRLNNDGSLDSARVSVINLTPEDEKAGWDTVATFNGGVYGSITRSFVSQDPIKGEQITVVGNFEKYGSVFYERATRDYKPMDLVSVKDVLRMDVDGKIDMTYNFNPSGAPNIGSNGIINDAFLQPDHKLILIGNFTTYNGVSANGIVRLDANGNVDPTFNVGSGVEASANGGILSIQHDPVSGKYLLAGLFTSFNGQPAGNLVRLNADGSLDASFKSLALEGGFPTFAYQLRNGKVLVTGTFLKYDQVIRRGFLLLNNDGTLSQEFNNIGAFEGQLRKVIETTSSLGNPAVILIGYIQRFDDQKVGNILKVEIKE